MKFYLGVDRANWMHETGVPTFVSHRTLARVRRLPRAAAPWALDSGAFTDISLAGEFTTTPAAYVAAVRRYRDEIGQLDWAAPQDHMCEPWVLARSSIASTVADAQAVTIRSVLELRHLAADLPIIPVLQGQTTDDYRRHADAYLAAGVDLEAEATVGLGSVCRRQNTDDIGRVVAALDGVALHGFGVKAQGLQRYGWLLSSADSMAWSYAGRRRPGPCPVRGSKNCSHCLHWALEWRARATAPTPPRGVQMALFAEA